MPESAEEEPAPEAEEAAVAAEFRSPARLVLQARLDRPEAMANPEAPETLDKMRPRHHRSALAPAAPRNVSRLKTDSQARPDLLGPMASLGRPDRQPRAVEMARPARQARPVPTDSPEAPESLDSPDRLAKSPKAHHSKARPDLPAQTDSPEALARLANPEVLETPEAKDLPEMPDHPARLVSPDSREALARLVATVATALATIARRRAPPQAIERGRGGDGERKERKERRRRS